jgi:predicted nucleic acid-binding protein
MPARVFCDTSFFYSCLDARDVFHRRGAELATQAKDAGTILASTWDVVSETVTLLRYRCGYAAALDFLDNVRPSLDLVLYGHETRASAEELFRRYANTRRLSCCDAISIVVVTTLLDNIPCLSFDLDFRALGLKVLP